MDLRVLVLSADAEFGELLQAQAENVGCTTSLAQSYDEGSAVLSWAEAAVVDLAGEGFDDFHRMRLEAPTLRILVIAPDDVRAEAAMDAGAVGVLVEPFTIPEICAAVRGMGSSGDSPVIDLREPSADATAATAATADQPWWATR